MIRNASEHPNQASFCIDFVHRGSLSKGIGHDIARKRVGTTLGTHVNFYVDTILTDPGFNAENVSATPPDLAPVMSRSDLDAIVPFTSFYSAAKTVLGDDCGELRVQSINSITSSRRRPK